MLNAGDLVGNAFDSALYIPAIDVQYLSGTGSNNLQFQGIDIQPDTLISGQTVALNAIGTQTTTNLRYVFPGNFTVNQGTATAESVGGQRATVARASAQVPDDRPNGTVTLTLTDNGTLSFATGDTVTLNATVNYYYDDADRGRQRRPAQRQRHHLQRHHRPTAALHPDRRQLRRPPPGQQQHLRPRLGRPRHRRRAQRGRPGRQRLQLALYIPAIDVQYLSGTGSNNLQFQDIDIQPDTLTSGQTVALNAIGTQTTTNLRYVFPGNFTVNQGATLSRGRPTSTVHDRPASESANGGTLTLTDNGTLSFAAGDTVTLNATATTTTTTQIVVGSGGLLRPAAPPSTPPAAHNGGNYTQIVVNSGGQLARHHKLDRFGQCDT